MDRVGQAIGQFAVGHTDYITPLCDKTCLLVTHAFDPNPCRTADKNDGRLLENVLLATVFVVLFFVVFI